MGRWRWKDKYGGPPQRWLGPATMFAAGRGAYGRDALPAWVTDGTDEQPTVDPWHQEVPAEPDDESDREGGKSAVRRSVPPNRSVRFRGECGADRGYPPGWR